MIRAILAAMIAISAGSGAFAISPEALDAVARYPKGKTMSIADVAVLMTTSERWCYAEQAGTCAWSDIYLDVTTEGARFELSNAWDEATDLALIDRGSFRDNRFICESGEITAPSLRATHRNSGLPLGGRELETVRSQFATLVAENDDGIASCFSYRYERTIKGGKAIILRQSEYKDGVTLSADDTLITVHFEPEIAAALKLRW